jgi:mono/diheme cytochrome c family protein
MKTIRTVVATLVVLVVLGIAYIYSGLFDVAATSKDSGLIHWAVSTTRERSIDSRGEDIQVPASIKLDDPKTIQTGFDHYNEMCVACHGAPGEQPGELRAGLNPKPPLLYKFKNEDPPGEVFWIIKHGIKMTAMPGWGPTHSDDKIWAMVAFVKKLHDITPEQYQAMKKADKGGDHD